MIECAPSHPLPFIQVVPGEKLKVIGRRICLSRHFGDPLDDLFVLQPGGEWQGGRETLRLANVDHGRATFGFSTILYREWRFYRHPVH